MYCKIAAFDQSAVCVPSSPVTPQPIIPTACTNGEQINLAIHLQSESLLYTTVFTEEVTRVIYYKERINREGINSPWTHIVQSANITMSCIIVQILN